MKLLQVYANEYEEVDEIEAGNIAVVIGFSQTSTGDTIISPKEKRRLTSTFFFFFF